MSSGIRNVLLVAVLALVPIAVAAAPGSDPTSRENIPSAGRDPRIGNPFLKAPLWAWVPTLVVTHSWDAAARAAVSHPGHDGDDPSGFARYELHGMGDVNGDDHDDVVLAKDESSGRHGTTTLSVLSGSDWRTLWTHDVPDDGYWYLEPTLSSHPGSEIVTVGGESYDEEVVDQRTNDASVSWMRYTQNMTYKVLAPDDGRVLHTIAVQDRFEYNAARLHQYASGTGSASLGTEMGSSKFTTIVPIGGSKGSGFDLLTVEYQGQGASVHGLSHAQGLTAVFADGGMGAASVHVERRGEPARWTYTSLPGLATSAEDAADVTGDGLSDWLLLSEVGLGAGGHLYGAQKSQQASVGAGVVPRELTLIDGASGARLWTYRSPAFDGRAYAMYAGAPKEGSARVAFVRTEHDSLNESRFSTVITLLDGANGKELGSKRLDQASVALESIGDANHDGDGDLLATTMRYDGPRGDGCTMSLWRSDFSSVWDLEHVACGFGFWVMATDGMMLYEGMMHYGFSENADLDGDGVDDLLFHEGAYSARSVRGVSTQTGKDLWTIAKPSRVLDIRVLGDIDGRPGDEVAFVFSSEEAKSSPFVPSTNSTPKRQSPASAQPAVLEIHRGTDAASMWSKVVYEPAKDPKARGSWLDISAAYLGDLTGDGRGEVALSVSVDGGYPMAIISDTFAVESQPEPTMSMLYPGPRGGLSYLLAIDGASGETLRSFPDGYGAGGVVPGPAFGGVTVIPAEEAPGLAFLGACLAWAVVALARRSRRQP